MILVILGTQNKQFTRLLGQIEELKRKKIIKGEIIVQSGHTKFESDLLELRPTIPHAEILKIIKKSDLVISHGGVGTIMDVLEKNKKIIVAPRLKKYNEHDNDHQLEIVDYFSKKGYILPLYEEDDLEQVLEQVKTYEFKKYIRGNQKMIEIIENFINYSS